MRKVIIYIMVIGLTGISVYLTYQILTKRTQLEESAETRQNIDWFREYLQNDPNIELKNKVPAVLIFFNPDCDFCQHEAQAFQENMDLLDGVKWFWISESEQKSIDRFAENYSMHQISDLHIIRDPMGILSHEAGISTIPQILIYDESGYILKEFKGETKIEAILDIVKQNH